MRHVIPSRIFAREINAILEQIIVTSMNEQVGEIYLRRTENVGMELVKLHFDKNITEIIEESDDRWKDLEKNIPVFVAVREINDLHQTILSSLKIDITKKITENVLLHAFDVAKLMKILFETKQTFLQTYTHYILEYRIENDLCYYCLAER